MDEDGKPAVGGDPTTTAGADAPPPVTGAGRDGLAGDQWSLFVWATGTFHAALLVTVLVAALHRSGAAGDLLQGVGTIPGALVYLYLWAVTLATTRRALRTSGVTPAGGVPDGKTALRSALFWGGVTGLGFYAGPYAIVALGIVLRGGLDAVGVVVLLLAVGGIVATVAGAVVGAVLALLDLALLRAAVQLTGDLSRGGP